MSPPIAKERVLPTLNTDGTRRRIRPRLYRGPREQGRRITAIALMVLFAGLPFVKVGGKPLLLLDIVHREFIVFGRTFLPTDGVLLMLLLLSIFVAVFLTTALVGRGWCGWACPQTVYMEYLFRPIERLFEGSRENQIKLDQRGPNLARIGKNAVFLLVAFVLGNLFLSYFVGVEALLAWSRLSPLEHWTPFVIVLATTGLVFFDFAYFREQMCTVACPYARLQSVLLDPSSLVVGYDRPRGEPRAKGKPRPGVGDCIDCGACVAACPTGIDIRDGLQLECIACAQCADACDVIMHKIHKPLGLIRYGSSRTLETRQPTRVLRPRVLLYSLFLLALVAALIGLGAREQQAEVTVLRGLGAPFELNDAEVTGALRIKIHNRSGVTRNYSLEVVASPKVKLIAPENPLQVAAGSQRTTTVFTLSPRSAFVAGTRPIEVRVSDADGFSVGVPYRLVGPEPGVMP